MNTFEYTLDDLQFVMIREMSIQLLEQAYNTYPFEYQSSDKATRLEELVYTKYKYSTEQVIGKSSQTLTKTFKQEYVNEIVFWALHLSWVTQTGHYSENINKQLRSGKLQTLPKKNFVELFDNVRFSEEERAFLEKQYYQEYDSLHEAFLIGLLRLPGPETRQFFRHRNDFDLENTDCTDLFSECCSRNNTFAPQIYQLFVEHDSKTDWNIFELQTKELLRSVLTDQKNPKTGLKYDQSTLQKVRSRFSKEMKLIQHGLDFSTNNDSD